MATSKKSRQHRKHRRLSKARLRTGTNAGVKHKSPAGRTGQIRSKRLMGCGTGRIAKRKQ